MKRFPAGVYSIVNRFSSSGIPTKIFVDDQLCEVNFDTMLVIYAQKSIYYDSTIADNNYNNSSIMMRRLTSKPDVVIGNTTTFTQ